MCVAAYRRSPLPEPRRNASFLAATTTGRVFEGDHLAMYLRIALQSAAHHECFNLLRLGLRLAPALQRASAVASFVHTKKLLEQYCIAAYSLADELLHPIEPTAFAGAMAFFLEELVAVAHQHQQHQHQQHQHQQRGDEDEGPPGDSGAPAHPDGDPFPPALATLTAAVMMALARLVGRVRVACYRGHRDSLANPCCLAGEGSAPLALANKVRLSSSHRGPR